MAEQPSYQTGFVIVTRDVFETDLSRLESAVTDFIAAIQTVTFNILGQAVPLLAGRMSEAELNQTNLVPEERFKGTSRAFFVRAHVPLGALDVIIAGLRDEPHGLSPDDWPLCAKEHTMYLFKAELEDHLLAADISNPGGVGVWRSAGVLDQVLYNTRIERQGYYSVRYAVEFSEKEGWPALLRPSLATTFCWLADNQRPFHSFSGTRVGRAIDAYSMILAEDKSQLHTLMWALIGLEALYCRGTGDLQRQLVERVQALLGTAPNIERRIRKMYDFRSRFVHGDLDFPGQNCRDMSEKHVKHEEDLDAVEGLAVAMLVATLQHLISRGWTELEFETRVIDQSQAVK